MQQIPLKIDGDVLEVSAPIVRSWCTCDICGDTTAGLRWASFTDVPPDVAATSVDQQANLVSIDWSDGHTSTINLDAVVVSDDTGSWGHGQSVAPSVTAMPFSELTSSDDGLFHALDTLTTTGVIHVTGGPTGPDSTAEFAERFGPVHVTSYGKVQVFITSPDARTAAHTGAPQHPHTDEPYRYSPPGYLFFHSVSSAPVGEGTSLLVDGFAAANQLREQDPDTFRTLTEVPVLSHRRHDGDVRFATRSRVISLHPNGDIQAIRINSRCLAPLDPFEPRADEIFHAITAFSRITENPDNQTSLHLHSGDFLVFDNNRIMHGRTAFSNRSHRHLQSCHVDKDGIHSTYRVLSDKLGRIVPSMPQGPVT